MLGDYLSDELEHYADFSNDVGFNSGFNLEDYEVNLNKAESCQIYPVHLDKSVCLISSV